MKHFICDPFENQILNMHVFNIEKGVLKCVVSLIIIYEWIQNWIIIMNEKYQYELGEWVVMVVKYNKSDTIHTIVMHKIFYILVETSLLFINVKRKTEEQ